MHAKVNNQNIDTPLAEDVPRLTDCFPAFVLSQSLHTIFELVTAASVAGEVCIVAKIRIAAQHERIDICRIIVGRARAHVAAVADELCGIVEIHNTTT